MENLILAEGERGGLIVAGISIRQIKAARELLAWSQETLAKQSGVNLSTIQRLEARGGNLAGLTATRDRIMAAFERAEIVFLDGDGVTLRRRK